MGLADSSLEFAAIDHRSGDAPWKVLIADDEPEIHDVTRLVLGNFEFAARPLEFLSAYSAAEARELLRRHPDTAVLLLDVVMESEQAGLGLVRSIRGELGNPFVRIVLRTGQAGQAPETEVIAAYDINDYKEKTELTASRLATTMYAALRAYRDMRAIEAHRSGLESVIRASAQVFARQNSRDFATAVLSQLGELVGLERGALYCTVERGDAGATETFRIAAATGDYRPLLDGNAEDALPAPIAASLREAFHDKRHHFDRDHYVLHFTDSRQTESLLFVGEGWDLSPLDYKLVELFCTNVSIAFDNLHLKDELLEQQQDMLYLLAGAAETRSQETANHVRRVGLLAELLGRRLGLDPSLCEMLRHAAPLHDIGKIGIPDTILNKPGPHTPEEAAVMRTHAAIGARLLGASRRPVMRLAAEIALAHHENWDGSGYPQGLAGEAIPVGGRITMVADVFDALGSRRCYKAPWQPAQIRAHMQAGRGRKFDPAIVDRLFACWDEALDLRRALPD
jgi:response regulator RpfG family c-di-GMP phosphodiesterase